MSEHKIISVVRGKGDKQRRITIPREDETLKEGDYVEIKKINIK